jgi:hypothetical protein
MFNVKYDKGFLPAVVLEDMVLPVHCFTDIGLRHNACFCNT